MSLLQSLDISLFLAINHLPHPSIVNDLARFLSGIGQWGAIWFILAVILFFREEKRDHWFFAPFIFSSIIGWVVSEVILKWLVRRPRPSVDIGAIILTKPGNFSFPSTHATLAWAMAYLLSREEPRLRWLFYTLAICICLSRIYLGVHFPTDIIAGGLIGWGIGWSAVQLDHILNVKKKRARR